MNNAINCSHDKTEHRIWTLSNGTKQIILQCLDCGDKKGGAIKRTNFTAEQLATMAPIDQEIIERTRTERKIYNDNYAKEQTAKFQITRKEHTEEYHAYLLSPEWRTKRTAVLRRANFICEGCLIEPATQVHHLTYAHIFDELLFELVAICNTCHTKAHAEERK